MAAFVLSEQSDIVVIETAGSPEPTCLLCGVLIPELRAYIIQPGQKQEMTVVRLFVFPPDSQVEAPV